jgi:hypothetical protein
MSEFKGSIGEVKAVFTSDYKRAVRNKGGIICVLTKPHKYPNQDERYEKELEENKHDQSLIIDAFKVRQSINCELSELLEQRNKMLAMLERISVMMPQSQEIKRLIKKVKGNG